MYFVRSSLGKRSKTLVPIGTSLLSLLIKISNMFSHSFLLLYDIFPFFSSIKLNVPLLYYI